MVSNAERRALVHGEPLVVPRVIDIYAALPSMTGKFELEYEGELKGAEFVARDLVRGAVSTVFDGYFLNADVKQVVEWFDLGGTLNLSAITTRAPCSGGGDVQGLVELARRGGIAADAPTPVVAAPSTSCSRASARRRRSAAPTTAAITAPNRSAAASRQHGRPRCSTPDDEEEGSPGRGRRSAITTDGMLDAGREVRRVGTVILVGNQNEIQIFKLRS